MPRGPNQKRMCNPAGIPDAKFFAEKKRRKGRKREKPLPGTKQTLSSENDGQLEQLFTAHDSTMVPKPDGGRQLVLGNNDGQLDGVMLSQTRKTTSSPIAKPMGQIALGLSLFMLVVLYSGIFVNVPNEVTVVCFIAFFLMNIFAIASQLMSDGRNGPGLLSLAIFYPAYVVWCLIVGLI